MGTITTRARASQMMALTGYFGVGHLGCFLNCSPEVDIRGEALRYACERMQMDIAEMLQSREMLRNAVSFALIPFATADVSATSGTVEPMVEVSTLTLNFSPIKLARRPPLDFSFSLQDERKCQ